jgi:ABC-type Zn uptake system ZnuABC Zn-binding protein ZnuA
VTTTTIVGDVVRVVGGDTINLTVLMGVGMDPHTFEPSPRDAAAVAEADVLFINGGGLEQFIEPLMSANVKSTVHRVDLCAGLSLMPCQAEHHKDHAHEVDPHVWFDPRMVMRWTETIAGALGEHDPEHASLYQQRAEAYRSQLAELDQWITTEAAALSDHQRRLVTDHDEFGYFARRYRLEITGALLPNVTTAAETSARAMAALENRIRATGTRVLVIGVGVNPGLAQRVAHDTGLRVVTLYTGALSASPGPAATYLDYMRYNAATLFNAMKASAP